MQAYFASLTSAPIAVEVAIKGALWLGAIFVITFALRNASAAARHLVWCIGVVGLFALPLLAQRLEWRIALPATATHDRTGELLERSGAAQVANAAVPEVDPAATLGASPTPGPNADERSVGTGTLSPGAIVLALWAAGSLFLLLRLARSVASARKIVANAQTCDDERLVAVAASLGRRIGAQRRVLLLTATDATIPFTTGLLRPVVVLPAGAEEWSHDRQEAVLLHELAHVARLDLWTSLAAHVACALYWFNPLVWIAARRLRIEGERACDDVVLRCGTRASDYADQLLEVVRETKLYLAPAVAVAMARRSAFEGRLLAILSPETNRARVTLRLAAPIALGMTLIALPIAAMSPAARVAEPRAIADDSAPMDSAPVSSAAAPSRQDTLPRDAAVRGLVSALRDDDEEVRVAAIHSLARREVRTIVPDLIPLVDDTVLAVRRAAVEALSQMPDPRAITALVQALRSDSDAGVRELAAQALGQIDDERATPGLVAALRQERVSAVRRRIVWALAEIESRSAAGALVDALRDDDAEVRGYAASGLGSMDIKTAAPQIIPLLRDRNADVRQRAAHALGELQSMEALEELMAATSDANADVRNYAIDALSQLETTRALPAFLRALKDANVDVRKSAMSAISNIDGIDRAPREVLDALNDDDPEMRQHTLQTLAHIKDPASVSAIIPLTRSGQPLDVRTSAVEALGDIGGPQVEPVLLELIKDADPKIRRLAAQGLGRDK